MNIPFLPLANLSTFSSAYAQSDFFGKIIMIGLIALSLICWVVLIHKVKQTRQVIQISNAFHKAFSLNKERLLHLDLKELPKAKNGQVLHPYARIFQELKTKTVEILNKNHYFTAQAGQSETGQIYLSPADLEIVETHVLTTISAETKALEKNLYMLSTIATLAPFLGLLGTVWGILITFSELQTGGSVSSNAAMLGGLSTALATTVLGLVIAIPAIVAYNYLKSSITHYASDMEDLLYQLLSSVELQYRKTEL